MSKKWIVAYTSDAGPVIVDINSAEDLVGLLNALRRAADSQGWATQLFDEVEELLDTLERRRGLRAVYWREVWAGMIHTGDIKQDSLTTAVWLKRRLTSILKDLEETGVL